MTLEIDVILSIDFCRYNIIECRNFVDDDDGCGYNDGFVCGICKFSAWGGS